MHINLAKTNALPKKNVRQVATVGGGSFLAKT
jgi:hypothetical protein